MPAPQVPSFDKRRFPDAPWLSGFWELLKPFLDTVAEALGAPAWKQVGGESTVVVTPGTAGTLLTPLFIATPVVPRLVMVQAQVVDASGKPRGGYAASTASWYSAAQGGEAGISVFRLHTLNTLGTVNESWRLTVWVLPG